MDKGKGEWTSKADNGRKFRGQPRRIQASSVQRPFKKPRKTGAEKVLLANAIDTQLGYPLFVPETEEPYVEDKVITQAQAAVETIESGSSEDDNIPIAQTRLKSYEVVKDSDSEEEFTALSETGTTIKTSIR